MHDENYLIKSETLEGIADAIREKKQSQEPIAVSDFAEEIENLPTGADLSDYFTPTITNGAPSQSGILAMIKTIPSNTIVSGFNLMYAFKGCNNLVEFPLLDTSNVVNMEGMFNSCKSLTTLPLLDTSNVTNMGQMFSGCKSLTTLPLLDTSNVTSIYEMFSGCTSLENVSVNYNLSKVTNYSSLFNNCTNLKSVEFNNTIDKSSTNFNIYRMFYGCKQLTHIDLRYFDLTKITNFNQAFGTSSTSGVPDNCEIIVADQTQKDWMNTNFSRLTNVKTVAEYEAQ